MKILVTGGAGYLGSVMVTKLLEKKFSVTVLDNFFFNQFSLASACKFENFKLIVGDVRDEGLIKNIINDFDCVIPLAAIVGAPLSEKYPDLTREINYDSIKMLCDKMSPSQLMIMPVTNSGYGSGKPEKIYTEESPLNPISTYGVTKVKAEKIALERLNCITFRLATVFGMSPRMRIDLLVNNFVYLALKQKKISIFEGHFKRNYIHIQDVADVFIFALENFNKLKSNTYNFGLEDANLSKMELAEKIQYHIPELEIIVDENKKDPDKRNYIVSNKKILSTGFKMKWTLDKGIIELIKGLESIKNPDNFVNVKK
tara:strand:+ start:251 stop:1192 length:942 start_codon:yes stop_codon:yes gene_type:complete